MAESKVTPAGIVILVGGVVVLVGSFLDFYKFGGSIGFSAWSGDPYFPITIIPVLCGLAMALQVGLTSFANVNLPDRVLGLGWNQIHLALGFQAAIMMILWILMDKGGFDMGIGFWLMLLGSIALIVGAFLRDRESAPAA